MAREQGRGEKTVDPVALILIFFVTLYAGGWAAWHFGHAHISTAYAYLRYVEFYVFHALGELVTLPGLSSLHGWIAGLCAPSGWVGLCTRDFATVAWPEIANSSFFVNLACLAVLLVLSVRMFLTVNATHPKLRFTKRHTIQTFVKEQMEATDPATGKLLYPHLRMFSALNLTVEPLDHKVWGMSQTSRQFMFLNRLVAGWREEAGGFWAPVVDRHRAADVFRAQLGRHWISSANLSPAETLLVAIAVPRVAATDASLDDAAFKAAMAASDRMIRYCWAQFQPPGKQAKAAKGQPKVHPFAWLRPRIDLTEPREVIKQYIGHKAVQTILEHHAFNRTVIFALFTQARRLGVLQPAEMRWLRFYDRQLWYVLQTIGRQAAFAEAAGVLSHYLYESKAGVSIVEPQLDKAVNGLEAAVNNFKFTAADKARYEAEGQAAALPAASPDKEKRAA